MHSHNSQQLQQRAILKSIPPISAREGHTTASGVIKAGSLSTRNGLREALSEATGPTSTGKQIIRVVADNLTGLIYISNGHFITGARTSENEIILEGVDAIRRLLILQSGVYDVIAVERDALLKNLKQSLAIDARFLLYTSQQHPERSLMDIFEQQTRKQPDQQNLLANGQKPFSEVVIPAQQALKFTPPLTLRDPSIRLQTIMSDESKPSDILVEPGRLVRFSTVERYRANALKNSAAITEAASATRNPSPPPTDNQATVPTKAPDTGNSIVANVNTTPFAPQNSATANDRCRTIFEVLSQVYGK